MSINFSIPSALLSFLFYTNFLIGVPVITSVNPSFGAFNGGQVVAIEGTGLLETSAVLFGTIPALSVTIESDASMTATAPPGELGLIDVTVLASTENSTTIKNAFDYQRHQLAYVTYQHENNVLVLDLTTNECLGSIDQVGNFPVGIAIAPDGKKAYVSNNLDNSVTVINLRSHAISHVINGFDGPSDIAIAPDGKTAYVVNTTGHTILPIDLSTETIGIPIPTKLNPVGIAIDPKGAKAYVVNEGFYPKEKPSLLIIDLANRLVGPAIDLEGTPKEIGFTPDGSTVFITSPNTSQVIAFDVITNKIESLTCLGLSPSGLSIDPNGQRAYVTNADFDTVSVIDIATRAVIQTISTPVPKTDGPIDIAIAPNGQTAYIASSFTGSIALINLAAQTIAANISTSAIGVSKIVIAPDQAPTASFEVIIAPVGFETIFNARASTTPVGSIAVYTWDFGDGTIEKTSDSFICHRYLTGGSFFPSLQVENSGGTSINRTFTGQMVSNNGSATAFSGQPIIIPALLPLGDVHFPIVAPPSDFKGELVRNRFVSQVEYIHRLSWKPSPDPTVVGYQLSRNGQAIAIIPAGSPLSFDVRHRQKKKSEIYTLTAFNKDSLQSDPPLAIQLPARFIIPIKKVVPKKRR